MGRNWHTSVFLAFPLIDEKPLSVKILGLAKRQSRADVDPFEAAVLANPESTVIDGGKQRLVIQVTPMKKHSQIFIDISLRKIVRKLLKIQYRLRNSQAIGVDSTVRILSQAEFLCEKGTDAKPSAIQACLVMAEERRRKTKLDAIAVF